MSDKSTDWLNVKKLIEVKMAELRERVMIGGLGNEQTEFLRGQYRAYQDLLAIESNPELLPFDDYT